MCKGLAEARRGRCGGRPHALLFAPLTANTIDEWAASISDTLALGLITEGIGLQLPILALPHWSDAHNAHPAVPLRVETLRAAGVQVLFDNGRFVPHRPRHGNLDAYPWHAAVDTLP
ncbi:flavoprotein [Streptomyces sp. CT34]|uniref:flavoprotein n=1 Tax=Streptomyces sp. CT34 TaxID=1553907 RepID=UPI000A6AD679|nr:flavoprotein [Streptomyces sp. CT34]